MKEEIVTAIVREMVPLLETGQLSALKEAVRIIPLPVKFFYFK